jgi:2-aminoadipate transaminase
MLPVVQFDEQSHQPLYRQLFDHIADAIRKGVLSHGDRLPPTRELAGQLGLNRATVSAAYSLLETEGLIRGHVGRGSFVEFPNGPEPARNQRISFESSRPADDQFPMEDFRTCCAEVTTGPDILSILQLGAPAGYGPLRRILMAESIEEGCARETDDILITNGCQQALDLIQRIAIRSGESVAVEDPVYHGLKNVFARAGSRLCGIPMGFNGIDTEALARLLTIERPKLLVVTPNFQNPTGLTMPFETRRAVVRMAREFGVMLIENDIYGQLRYEGEPLPTLKQLDESGSTVLLRSFSKVAFPGLRVGWVLGPRGLISDLVEARQWCDLHTDQLSQAILCRFAESGRLEAHLSRVRKAGKERLAAVLRACERYLPAGTQFTRPQGGMSLWVRLPAGDAAALLPRVQQAGVSYVPGRHFAVMNQDPCSLRLSFGGVSPDRIESGIAAMGRVLNQELERAPMTRFEASSALV